MTIETIRKAIRSPSTRLPDIILHVTAESLAAVPRGFSFVQHVKNDHCSIQFGAKHPIFGFFQPDLIVRHPFGDQILFTLLCC